MEAVKKAALTGQNRTAGKKFWTPKRKEALVGWLFLTPEIIGMLLLNVFALGFSLYLSFSKWDMLSGVSGIEWIGLGNYAELFRDPAVIEALKNNLLYTVMTVPVPIAVALVLAVVINNSVF